ncbi:hypothetical protein Tco_1181165 [Tanacetum coccineum]
MKNKKGKGIDERQTKYGMQIPERMLNDDIKESSAYKMYLMKIRKLAILMDQPQMVEPTKGTNREPSASSDDDPDEERQRIEMEKNATHTLEKRIDTDGDISLDKIQNLKGIETISPEEQELINGGRGVKGEGLASRIDTQEYRDPIDSDINFSDSKKDDDMELDDDDSEGDDDISCYPNERPAPSLGEFGLPRIAGLLWLNSRDESSVEEKPDGDSFYIERLNVESKTDKVLEVTMTEPTGLPQGGTTRLKYVLITPEATLTLVLTPGGNPGLTSIPTARTKARLDDFLHINIADAIDELVGAHVINEVKNPLQDVVPKAVEDYIRPRLQSTVLHILRNKRISLTTTPRSSTTNLTIPEMKAKLLDMIYNEPKSIEGKCNLKPYNALLNVFAQDEQIARKESWKEVT